MTRINFERATITFDEDTEYVNRNYETASWWTRHIIPAGTYDLELTSIGGHRWSPGIPAGYVGDPGPYYAKVSIPGTTVEKYFVNRLFTASSVQHDRDVSEPCNVHLSLYAYQVTDGLEYWGGTIHTHGEPLDDQGNLVGNKYRRI